MRTTMLLGAAASALVLSLAGSANAIEYGADLVIPKENGTWQVHVEGFEAGDSVTVTLECEGEASTRLGTTTAASDGTIDEFYTLPAGTTTKSCVIRVVGGTISKSFVVGSLPETGSSSLSTLAVGSALLAVGAVVTAMSSLGRRRSARA